METVSQTPYISAALLGGAISLIGMFLKSIYDAYETRRKYHEHRDNMQKAIYADICAFSQGSSAAVLEYKCALANKNWRSKHGSMPTTTSSWDVALHAFQAVLGLDYQSDQTAYWLSLCSKQKRKPAKIQVYFLI